MIIQLNALNNKKIHTICCELVLYYCELWTYFIIFKPQNQHFLFLLAS